MPSGDANGLSNDVETFLKISDVRSLSPNAGESSSIAWKDPTVKCTLCFAEIPKYKLKDHILTSHFAFYRPYKCKECEYKCGDTDIFLQDHMMSTGHEEGCAVVGTPLPYLERLIDLIYVHCRKLSLGDYENVKDHLKQIKDSASTYGQISDCSTPNRTQNGSASKGTRNGSNMTSAVDAPTKSPGRSTATSRRAGESAAIAAAAAEPAKRRASPSKRPPMKKPRGTANKNPNRKKSIFYKCQQCHIQVHVDERRSHCAGCSNASGDVDIDENSPSFHACFGNADQELITDSGGSEHEDNRGSDSDESDRLAAPSARRSRSSTKPSNTETNESDDQQSALEEPAVATHVRTSAAIDDDRGSSTTASDVTANNFSVQSDDNASNRSTPQNARILLITCDYCSKICENQDLLKAHCLEHHVGGFSAFYCSAAKCGIKDPSSRRLSDHCRSVHKNPKLMKKSVPTDEQKRKLIELKESLGRKGITFDVSCYGISI